MCCAGLVGLFRTIALEGEPHGITANLLNPGALIAGRAHRRGVVAGASSPFMDQIPGVSGDDIRATFLPERVSPMVAVLAHRKCPCTGQILGAWGGRFARSTITTAPGLISTEPPTAEDVLDHWAEIVDQTAAVGLPDDVMIFAFENMRRLYGH
jgi:hypothetical protein